MSSIWSWGRPSKVDCNSTLPLGSLILHILTSLGRFDFWQGKWTPNWKIPVGLESRLKDLSNELSCTWFRHREGLQKPPAKRDPLSLARDPLKARDPSGHLQQCKNYTGATRWGRATHQGFLHRKLPASCQGTTNCQILQGRPSIIKNYCLLQFKKVMIIFVKVSICK